MAWLKTVDERGAMLADHDTGRLEELAAGLAGAKYCVLTESAFDGLAMAMGICGIGSGDEVLCSPLAGRHVHLALRSLEAIPVYVDINPNSLNIDPFCLDYILRKRRREKAEPPKLLVASDQFGLPCNYGELEAMCQKNGFGLIEDMESGFGGSFRGRPAGGFGRFAVASILGDSESGSDGAVFCREPGDAETLRSLREDSGVRQVLHGLAAPDPGDGLVQGTHLEKRLMEAPKAAAQRQIIAGMYREKLKGHVRYQEAGTCGSAYTRFAVLLKDGAEKKAVTDAFLRERIPCIETSLAYTFSDGKKGDWGRAILANAEHIAKKLFLLPMHQYLTENVVSYICDILIAELGASDI